MEEAKHHIPELIQNLSHEKRKKDSIVIYNLFYDTLKMEPEIWQKQIIGFGKYQYKSKSGREGDWLITGFSARKTNLSLYFMCGFDYLEDSLAKLGKYKTGRSCLYINKIEDVDLNVLKEMIVKCSAKFES